MGMTSGKRGGMSRQDRAKQFMPFDALKGFREALVEQERIVREPKELSEEQNLHLNWRLDQLREGDEVIIDYFQDKEYKKAVGIFLKSDRIKKSLIIKEDSTGEEIIIPLQDMFELWVDRSTEVE